VETPDGRRVPLDVLPDTRGNYLLLGDDGATARLVTGVERLLLHESGERLFLDHHATCPKVERVRAGELQGQGTLF
jgi:hypothetical protein